MSNQSKELTAEEILKKHYPGSENDIIEAMQEYADQQTAIQSQRITELEAEVERLKTSLTGLREYANEWGYTSVKILIDNALKQ